MSDQANKWDRQWNELLTHCHGNVEADAGFKANLLDELKTRMAERNEVSGREEAEEDKNWSTLLRAGYVPCRPSDQFKDHLLSQLKARQTQLSGPVRSKAEDESLMKILKSSYTPVEPRREFQTRLLENLKERQRNTTIIRRQSRKRTIFMSALSSMAAAAAILFVVWTGPVGAPASPAMSETTLAMLNNLPAATEQYNDIRPAADMLVDAVIPAAAGLAFASTGKYRIEDAFRSSPLPNTVRGIGIEVDSGDGWHPMDQTLVASLTPGMAFRTARGSSGTAGLGFGDGSTILMCSDSVIESTEQGFTVKRGTVAVEVRDDSSDRFRLHFPERDIAIEPGTMLAVSVEPPDNFAPGGAPAPIVRVADGGLAVARGKNGSGPMFANHVYQLDNYVTPDIPGRPICEAECADLRSTFSQASTAAFASTGNRDAARLVVSGNNFSRSLPPPEGFVKRDTRWLADSYQDGQPTVRIKYLSDDYFGLASERRDLAPALALGGEVVIDGGDGGFYEIHK